MLKVGFAPKTETDKLSTIQIKQLIDEALLGKDYTEQSRLDIVNGFGAVSLISNINQDSPDSIQLFENPIQRLLNRNKWAHLTYREQLHVYDEYKNKGKSINDICREYGLSLPTVKRVIKLFSTTINRANIYTKIRCRKLIEFLAVQNMIRKYVESTDGPFVASHIQQHLEQTLSVWIPLHQIRFFLKTDLHLSFKRGSKRPSNIDRSRSIVLKRLYAVRLTQKLPTIKLLCNLDESVINRDTISNYSWLKRGVSWCMNNVKFKRSINMISWIATNGMLISMLKHTTTDSYQLIDFLKHMLAYIDNRYEITPNQVGIVLDNCSTHRSRTFRVYCCEAGVSLYYILAYSPEL